MSKEQSIRPTKKQRELLNFIEQFITEHGYSPSYREVMNGLNYTSVATVSLHVNSLIRRGHLRKRDRSARSLEVVKPAAGEADGQDHGGHQEDWLVSKVTACFDEIEQAEAVTAAAVERLKTLVSSLEILGLNGHAQTFSARLDSLQKGAEV